MQSTLPIRLSLEESSVAALAEAADRLGDAASADAFLSALDGNYRLWRALIDASRRNRWDLFDHRTSDFIMATLRKCGRGVVDADIETLIEINHRTSRSLAPDGDVGRIRERATLAWRKSSRNKALPLGAWLVDQIELRAGL